jgi:PDZ domain-containing protein
LHAGDRILRLNGKRIHYQAQIPPLVQALRPGQIAHIVFVRHGKRHRVALKTVPSTNGTPNPHGKTALVGILAQDEVKFPIKVRINSGDIGGPSAGLMFALGIVQRLTGKDIAHGCKVAGTGTIDFDGTVGAIGGAKQKVIAARDAGAQYFLVPDVPDNVGPAKTNRGNVKVVPVRTLRQALAFLRTLRPCR